MRRDNKAFKERFARWKNGELVYDKGRPLPAYQGGKDTVYDRFVNLMGPLLYLEMLRQNTPNADIAYDNMMRQLAYESNYGQSNVALKQHNYGGVGWNGKTYTTFKDDADFIKYYVTLMNDRYADAVNAGSIQQYARALKDYGYYEDSFDNYSKLLSGMKSLSASAAEHRKNNPDLYSITPDYSKSLIEQMMNTRPKFVPSAVETNVVPKINTDYSPQTASDPTIPTSLNAINGADSPTYGGTSLRVPNLVNDLERQDHDPERWGRLGFKYGKKSDDGYYSTMEKVAKDNYKAWGFPDADSALLHALNDNTYDYKGFYNKYPNDKSNANTHWTDEFKTVYHPTFSKESIYSGKKSQYNPEGIKGGTWLGEYFIPSFSLMFQSRYKYGKAGLPKYETGKDEEEFYQRMQERLRAINESQPKTFVDAAPDFKYNVDPVRAIYSDPQTGEVWQSGMPKGTIMLPDVTVKGSKLNAKESVQNLPVEKGLEAPMLDPLVLALGGGKYSGDLIGDLIGEQIGKGAGKLSAPIINWGKNKILSKVLKNQINNSNKIVSETSPWTTLSTNSKYKRTPYSVSWDDFIKNPKLGDMIDEGGEAVIYNTIDNPNTVTKLKSMVGEGTTLEDLEFMVNRDMHINDLPGTEPILYKGFTVESNPYTILDRITGKPKKILNEQFVPIFEQRKLTPLSKIAAPFNDLNLDPNYLNPKLDIIDDWVSKHGYTRLKDGRLLYKNLIISDDNVYNFGYDDFGNLKFFDPMILDF